MLEDGPGDQFLINCEQLEKVNFSTISKVFDRSLGLIYPNGIQHDNILLLLTDSALYMVKAANSLQALYSKMVHVTCLAHALHQVVEELQSQFPEVDRRIGCIKKFFLKAPSRVATLKSEAPEVPLPPSPVVTRWEIWIEACDYYCENIEVVKRIIDMFVSSDAASTKLAQELLSDSELAGQRLCIKTNFGFLPGAITCLEKSGVKLVEQRDLVKKVASDLENVNGKVGKDVAKKLMLVWNKNKGFATLSSIADVLSGEKFSLVDLPGDLEASDFKYAPLVSVQVERSFSMYKALLADKRQSFYFENLRMIFIVHCNSGLMK